MFSVWRRKPKGEIKNFNKGEIAPDEVFMDAKNLPAFDRDRMEGNIEQPVSKRSLFAVGLFFFLLIIVFTGKSWSLQVVSGEEYARRSEQNRFHETSIIAERGIVTDRNGELLIWNAPNPSDTFPLRKYIEKNGFGHLLGYVSYPQKDSSGFFYETKFVGKEGIEKAFEEILSGTNGLKITEVDALGNIESESLLKDSEKGESLRLSIDYRIQKSLHDEIKSLSERVGFVGGSGAIMDIRNGEIIAITNYPEYDPQIISEGKDIDKIKSYAESKGEPYLNRAVSGLYTPGSIVKPFIAIGVLAEKIISPEKEILSTGSISIPNPYDKTKSSIFRDWKAHGWVDMREAIAVSSDVYFYEVGGGYKDQKGLGIERIEKYLRLFGFGSKTGIDIGDELTGIIPNPAWKEELFDGDPWRVGDTYNTTIGQYGTQVTPAEVLRATASLGNGGFLVKPTVLIGKENQGEDKIPLDEEDLKVVRDGMRLAVTSGTASALNVPYVKIAGKTGTAELGITKQTVNSWVIGYFPYENPKYAFVVLMEKGPRNNLVGATSVMRNVFDFMSLNTKEYF